MDNMLSAKENAKHVRERDRQVSNLSHNILNIRPFNLQIICRDLPFHSPHAFLQLFSG